MGDWSNNQKILINIGLEIYQHWVGGVIKAQLADVVYGWSLDRCIVFDFQGLCRLRSQVDNACQFLLLKL